MPAHAINTKKAHRRPLRFSTIDDVLADAGRHAAADRDGRLEHTGNWSLGQALGQIAGWAGTPYNGYPPNMPKPPRIITFLLRALKG